MLAPLGVAPEFRLAKFGLILSQQRLYDGPQSGERSSGNGSRKWATFCSATNRSTLWILSPAVHRHKRVDDPPARGVFPSSTAVRRHRRARPH